MDCDRQKLKNVKDMGEKNIEENITTKENRQWRIKTTVLFGR
jgi:hypothetical protein